MQRDTTGLTNENKELKLKLQAMEQQAHLRDGIHIFVLLIFSLFCLEFLWIMMLKCVGFCLVALNDALRNELQWLKITAGQISGVNGNNRGQPRTNHYFGNDQAQQR